MALRVIAAVPAKELELRFRLDALGDDLEPQTVGHLDDRIDNRGVVTIDTRSGAVTRNVEYYALAHASRFVRPGARRIASTAGVDGLENVAFRNGSPYRT